MGVILFLRENKILSAIIFVAFAASIIHSFCFRITPHVDARAYDTIATNFLNGYGYIEKPNLSPEDDFSIIRVGPAYEFFLVGVYFLFGHHYEAVWFFQAIFHALSALLVFLISKQVFKTAWRPFLGYVAASFVAFSPDLIVASSMLLAENFGIFLILICVYFFFRHLEKNDWFSFSLFVLFFGMAAMTRSPFFVFVIIFSGFFALHRNWYKLSVFLIILVLIYSPWVLRNYMIYKEIIPFSAALGYDLWVGNHHGASGELEDFQPLMDYLKTHRPVEVNKYGISRFFEFVSDYPLEFIQITLNRLSLYFSVARPTGFWFYFPPIQQIITAFFSGVYSFLLFVFGFLGAYFALKESGEKEKMNLKILALMAVFMPMAIMIIVVETRYRFLIYPFLAVFAGFGVYYLAKLKRGWRTLVAIFFLVLANALFDLVSNKDVFIERLGKFF